MTPTDPEIPPDVRAALGVAPLAYLGGRVNRHWLVDAAGTRLVLRAWPDAISDASIDYELAVHRRLHAIGWPVPVPIDSRTIGGRRWTRFTRLPGVAPRVDANADERRGRGRLLAALHGTTKTLVDLGQRDGWTSSDLLVRDPALRDAITRYERVRPTVGHLLRWHLDATIAAFDRLPVESAPRVVLHGDFAPWNLLRDDAGRLAGLIDFEAAHLNLRVVDFALAWRGYQDDVIDGYESISPLSESEHALVVPTFWAWMFLDVRAEVGRMLSGEIAVHDFEWPVKQLTKRSTRWPAPPYVR